MTLRRKVGSLVDKWGMRTALNYVRLLFTPFGAIRNYVLFPIGFFFRKQGFLTKDDKKLFALKNKHKGERVFIIATGPSLRIEDVEMLKDEHTIGVNSIFRIFDKIDWRPDYYCSLDCQVMEQYMKDGVLNLETVAKEKCFMNSILKNLCHSSKSVFIRGCYLNHYYHYGSLTFKYSPNLECGMYDFYSVTHSAIMLAIYMGFKDIYLLGVDNNYVGSKTHFIESDTDEKHNYDFAVLTQNSMDAGYKEILKIANEAGVKVFNATRGGRLEVFPRVELENVMK